MKTIKKGEKDPIKDKYTKKIGFFKKIQINLVNFKKNIIKNNSIQEDINSSLSIVVAILLYGLIGGLSLSLFGVKFNLMNFLAIGSLLWLIENKFIDFIVRIFSAIKLVDIN